MKDYGLDIPIEGKYHDLWLLLSLPCSKTVNNALYERRPFCKGLYKDNNVIPICVFFKNVKSLNDDHPI